MKKNTRNIILIVLIIAFFAVSVFTLNRISKDTEESEYYEIVDLIENNKISEFELNLYNGDLSYKLRSDDKRIHHFTVANYSIFYEDVNEAVKEINKNAKTEDEKIKFNYVRGGEGAWLTNMLPSLLLLGGIVVFYIFMMKRMNSTMGTDKTLGFGKAKIKKSDQSRKTTFADVAGEADVPFFSISGSDFVEMFVGVGASRVRDLFGEAKKNAPSIVFIDEIDAVGRQRGAGLGGGHDEREQTLNQLLVEMDGFGANEGVIVIAATNRPDILDRALLRPGRFDRQITVNYPDIKGREEILKVHSRGKPLGPDVNLATIAKSTSGFTGADLENLLNEAALLAVRHGKKAITQDEIEEGTIKVVMGTEKKSHVVKDKDKKVTAYHEAGHAIVSYFLPTQDPVHQISIIQRGMAAGYTMYLPEEERGHTSKNQMLEQICSLLGGRAAEQLTQDDVCTGASNDIERATDLARKMVTKFGMSDKLGLVTYGHDNNEVFLGRDFSSTPNYSEKTAAVIDEEIERVVMAQYKKAVSILEEHMPKLHSVAKELFENEKISGDDFRNIMQAE